MTTIRITSAEPPFDSQTIARQAVGVISTAEAMGLLEGAEIHRLDLASFRDIVDRIAEAGIGAEVQAALSIPPEELGESEIGAMLSRLAAAMEDSPSPSHEWPALEGLFGSDRLAELVGVSVASVRRYRSGARGTPDQVASRLHFLATVVGELAGAYNDFGIRRWFSRRRTLLGGKCPSDLLKGDWSPEDSGPLRVRELARSLGASAAT